MASVRGAAGALVAAALLAGCGSLPSTAVGAAGAPVRGTAASVGVQPRWASCAQAAGAATLQRPAAEPPGEPARLPRLGSGFTPAGVVVCATRVQTRPGGGQDLVAVEQHGSDVAALTAALRLPDKPPTTGACPSLAISVPWFALLDASGRWLRPGVPTDECDQPRAEVRSALLALHLRTVWTRTLEQVVSPEAARAGCPQRWSDMVWVEAHRGWRVRPGLPTGDPFPRPAAVRLCVYRVPADQRGSDKPAGQFSQGGLLGAARRAEVVRLLDAASPAGHPCQLEATSFAALQAADGRDPVVYVELDGCQRILEPLPTGGSLLAQPGGGLAAALLARG